MKVAYRENDEALLIQDQSQRNRLLLNISYICNLVTSLYYLISTDFDLSSAMNWFFIIQFIIFTVAIIRLNIIEARASVISLEEIVALKSMTSFNSIRYYYC